MRSTKTIGLFAACGFVLSFVAGLFSHSSILSVLIKALIFAAVFGALGFGITVVFSKFLDIGTSGDFQGDYVTDSVTGGAPASAPVTGQHVDITIQDEELKPSQSENHFVVGDNHQMLNESDVAGSKAGGESSSGFVPLRNFETVKNISGTESVAPSSANAEIVRKENAETVSPVETSPASYSEPRPSVVNSGEEGIDTLPDMDGFVFGGDSSNETESDDDDSSITDSGFSSYSSSTSKKSDGSAEVQDAALMAKAISSVLSDENSL